MRTKKFAAALAISVCTPAFANTGAPIFILVSTYVFIFGFALIVVLEALLIRRWVGRGWINAFLDSLSANALSSLIGGILLPFLVSAIGFFSYAMPRGTEKFFSHVGTMGYRNNPLPAWSLVATTVWFAITVVISTYTEARILKRRWSQAGHNSPIQPIPFCWRAHAISYPTMLIAFWALRLRA